MSEQLKTLQTEQAKQENQLMAEVVAKLEKFGATLAAMPAEIQKQVREDFKSIAKLSDDVEALRRDHTARFNAIAQSVNAGGVYRGSFRDANTARAAGAFFAYTLTREKAYLDEVQKAGIDTSTGEKGGFIVPVQFIEGIIRNVETYGVVEANINKLPGAPLQGSRAKRTQGALVYYPDMGVAPTESTLKFGRVEHTLKRWSAYVTADRWMLASDLLISLAQYIAEELGYALAYAEDLNVLMGDGTSTYARITGAFKSSANLSVVCDTGDNTFPEVTAASTKYLGAVAGTLPQWADDGAAWYLHRSIFWSYMGARDSQNRPITDIMLNSAGKPQRMLLGYPANISQVAPALSATAVSTTMALLANLKRSRTLARHVNGIELRQSDQVKFLEGQVVWVLDVLQDVTEDDMNAEVRLVTAAS